MKTAKMMITVMDIAKIVCCMLQNTLDPYISLFATKVMIIDSKEGSVRKAMLECIEKRGAPTMIIGSFIYF